MTDTELIYYITTAQIGNGFFLAAIALLVSFLVVS
jgi:hypothetical protein